MKRTAWVVFIFLGVQFLSSALAMGVWSILCAVRHQPFNLAVFEDATMLSLLLLATNLFVAGLLIAFRFVHLQKDFAHVRTSFLLLCVPLTIAASTLISIPFEELHLPNWAGEQFLSLSQNVWGLVGMVLIGPIVEELTFRVAIEGHLLRTGWKSWHAILLSAFVFSLVHGNPAQMPSAFLMGIFLGWLYWRTGSLWPSVVAHVANNAFSVCMMRIFPDSELTTRELVGGTVNLCLLLAVCAVVTAVCFWMIQRVGQSSGRKL